MARSKNAARRSTGPKKGPRPTYEDPAEAAAAAAAAQPVAPQSTHDLLVLAAQAINSLQYEQAKELCYAAVEAANEAESVKDVRDALEVLGTVELELGELAGAREHFLASINFANTLPDPSPAPHLYLAQLSTPEESLTHFTNALALLQGRLELIEKAKLGGDGGAGTEEEKEDEAEIRRSASRALVGMTELYLTDLCFAEDAESNCEKHLALAATLDPTDPEVYHTLASVRLSQSRPDDAKAAALQGWSLWKDLEVDAPDYPPSSARLTLAKVLLELSEHVSALEILNRLENEDDEDSEIWYLSGWAWWLLGEARAGRDATEEEESQAECWSEAKLCLENYQRLDAREPEGSDPEQVGHVQELLAKLEGLGVVASAGQEQEGEAEWEDDSAEEDAMEE